MRHFMRWLVVGLSALLVACTPDSPTEPVINLDDPLAESHGWDHRGIGVMTQNIYVGADVDAVLAALGTGDINLIQQVLAAQMQVLAETDFPTRAAAIADEIARRRPHVVGLQEMSRLHIDLNIFGVPAVYDMDFLPVLLDALRQRGLHYRVAGKVQNMTAEPVPGSIVLTDYDVILVDRRRVRLAPHRTVAQVYSANVGPVAPGVSLARGFVAIKVKVDERWYRVASTHLESDLGAINFSDLRAAQLTELLGVLGDAPRAIIMGDLNDAAGTPMYQAAVGAGYLDLWATFRPGEDGSTCCHSANLTDARIPDQRIDFIFARGFDRGHKGLDGWITRIGLVPEEMVPGPFHPIYAADHAGLVARLGSGH